MSMATPGFGTLSSVGTTQPTSKDIFVSTTKV
jgi:hypothetical protein